MFDDHQFDVKAKGIRRIKLEPNDYKVALLWTYNLNSKRNEVKISSSIAPNNKEALR